MYFVDNWKNEIILNLFLKSFILPLQALCSESQPCLNDGSCDSSGTCQCKAYYVGETCEVSVGKNLS